MMNILTLSKGCEYYKYVGPATDKLEAKDYLASMGRRSTSFWYMQ